MGDQGGGMQQREGKGATIGGNGRKGERWLLWAGPCHKRVHAEGFSSRGIVQTS